MTLRLSGHFSIFGLVFFVLKSLGISKQWIREKFAILTLKSRIHVRTDCGLYAICKMASFYYYDHNPFRFHI